MKGHFYMAMALLALLAVGCASCEREEGGKGPAPPQAEADSPEVEADSPDVEAGSPQVEVTSPGAGASFSEGEEIALRYRLRCFLLVFQWKDLDTTNNEGSFSPA